MKNLILSIVLLFAISVDAKVYYCSTTGSDSNPGTFALPYASWDKLASVLKAGDTGYIRGGTYRTNRPATTDVFCYIANKSGTSDKPIVISAYPGETPIFNLDNIMASGVETPYIVSIQNCSWIKVKGLRATGLMQNPNGTNYTYGWTVYNSNNITLEQCESDHNCEGFQFGGVTNMLVVNCDAHHLVDPYSPYPYNGSNGFSCTSQPSSVGVTFRGCRAWWCGDDGFDVYGSEGTFIWDNCWSFWNGYKPGTFDAAGNGDGFKLGPTTSDQSGSVKHFLNNCVSFQNREQGFDENDGRCINQLYNCTSYGNGGIGYHFGYQTSLNIHHILKNNVSFQDAGGAVPKFTTSWVQSNNTWNGITATAASFASLTNTGVDGARQSDGSLPNFQFLHLSSSSNLINAGVSIINMLFNGSAPDLGAFEYGGTSTANQAPVANAGSDQNITLPTSAVTLNGSGTDADGSITAYQWTKISGPTQFSIGSPSSATTVISNLAQGVYQFELMVTDNSGATNKNTVQVTVNAAANQSPVANAGTNQTITLPSNSVTLNGGNSKDADGSITSYAWSKVSGPSQGGITNAGSVSTTATNLAQGTYIFKLTVTDNNNVTGSDSVVITVNPILNQPPVANAGANKTITLPTNSITLDGSASLDPDGTISTYAWTKASGPSQGTITGTTNATTTVTNLVQGTYIFKLTVKDYSNATASDSITITVNAAPNQAPVADAGANQTITLPVNSVPLNGSASFDPDGTISSYAWIKASGPSQGSITNAANTSTTATNLVQGTYVFKLTVKDNSNATASDSITVTVNAAPNQTPVADAGTNQTITLPVNSVTLNGSASFDPDGTISSYAWIKSSGPSQGSITNAANTSTTATNLVQGTYVFKLTVKDNGNATASDSITVTVNAAPNQSPVADAGTNQTITLPVNSVTLNGSASFDPDGVISSYAWTKASGPSQGSITNTANTSTTATNLVQGTYVFKLTVKDNSNATASDSITITLNAAPNQSPVSDAGANQTITLPVNSVTLNGSASFDPDGTISTYAWTKLSGPSQGSITNAANTSTTATNLVQGTYIFKLTVKDNSSATASDSITVIVNAAPNQTPVADAGANQTITLPVNSATLNGSASFDPDGTISSYAWIKSSGPSQGSITNAANTSTTATNLVQGTYVFKLTVKDNGNATASDSITVTVNAAPNQSPVADAGTNQTITLPVNSVTLNGSASFDPDGTISSYAWIKSSGPSQGSITNAANTSTTATNLVQGTYIFKLTVKDNSNATASDSITITVNAATNQSPVADAGANKTIILPTNSVTLDGSASSDPDGTISTYTWTKSSGPSQASITNAANTSTTATNLVQGIYVFKLTVKDNSNATASDSITVTVSAAPNQPPVADAGANQTITLPVNSVTLNGSASFDPDGTIAAYAWSKTAGGVATISNASGSVTIAGNLQAGQYTFELTVTDNSGSFSRKTVRVTVLNAADQTPVADAGASQTITLPANSTTLNGSGSLDPDGSISSYAWSKISGPAQGNIISSNQSITAVNNLAQGVYSFRLTVTDNNGVSATDSVKVTVNAAANQSPVANAGTNKNITLPVNTVSIDGSGSSDADGIIVSYKWIKISGGAATIADDAVSKTNVSGLVGGQYTFELTVTDDKGASSKAQVKVTVNVAPNQSPVANAGTNKNITLPVNTVNLDGSGSSDADGIIVSYKWIKISGGVATIADDAVSKTTVSGLVAGQYTFELTVTDDKGALSKAQVKVTVNAAANQSPVVNAGTNKNITLPVNTVSLDGSGSSDADGIIVSYKWIKISGGAATITDDAASKTTVSGLVAGQYTFELTVTDDKGASSKAQVKVTVNAAANQSPVANAGTNKNITLPVNTVSLDGSGSSDADGSIVSYKWIKISGGAAAITDDAASKTAVSGLIAGQYTFELTVTDDKGASSKAQVKVTVNAAANQSPVANAGTNKNITLPVNTVNLDGSGSSDADGSIVSYKWIKISGGAAAITNDAASKTAVSGLIAGQYTFELTVTDDKGASSKAQVKVTVNAAANQSPVANTGTNKNITLPVNTVSLDGSGSSDADGSIVSYKWIKISGAAATITDDAASKTTVSGLVAGQYTFELTVTDDKGASSKAQVKVTVNAVANQSPVANAGSNLAITLPLDSVHLDGSKSADPDGTIVSYSWAKIAGGSGTMTNSNTPIAFISGLSPGQCTFELTVTDNKGANAKAQVKVTVNAAANQPPAADAGINQTLVFGTGSITLDG